ncbi:MAG: crotonase/enoyl-CoA hydratase family protein [Mariprofundaceae bacterium]
MHYNTNLKVKSNTEEGFTSLDIQYDQSRNLAWYYMSAYPRPCFTPTLLNEIKQWFVELIHPASNSDMQYVVLASKTENVFNLGGDLSLFSQLIHNQDRAGLLDYAISCIDVLFLNHTGLNDNVTTISLIQGDALGGGFEAAISSNVVIAERSAKMGMPEVLFNLFPGMGAYSFLSRKVGSTQAEKMILGGKLYSAEEMFDLGIVDVLAEDGEGEKAVYEYLKKENRAKNGYQAFRQAKQCCNPVSYDELKKITTIWVDAALKLEAKDLRMMDRLISRQSAKTTTR